MKCKCGGRISLTEWCIIRYESGWGPVHFDISGSWWYDWLLEMVDQVMEKLLPGGKDRDVICADCEWKKRAQSKPPLTPECSISPEKILLRPKCWYQTIFGSLSVGDTITALSSSISASGNLNSLRFVANVGKCKWDFYPNGKDYFALWHFKSCLHQKYEITPFKRMENAHANAKSWINWLWPFLSSKNP